MFCTVASLSKFEWFYSLDASRTQVVITQSHDIWMLILLIIALAVFSQEYPNIVVAGPVPGMNTGLFQTS